LLLVRHGETELKSSERLWGVTDVKLDTLGFRQAERLCDRLAGEKINAIYSSHLQRALITAKTIASRHQLEVITCPELREFNYGKVEGLTYEQIKQLYPEFHKSMTEKRPNIRFPGGESVYQLNNRVSQFLPRLKNHTSEQTILVVAHFGLLRVLLCRLLGISIKRRWQIHLDLASLSILETNQQGAILRLLNDVSHLARV
jgi:alpha-ribazole phosphatase